jgi:hypothetical protein
MSECIAGSGTLQKWPQVYYVGDRLNPIPLVYQDVDLTGWTVEAILARPTTALTKVLTITDATNGKAIIEWDASDLVEGFDQVLSVRYTDTTSKAITVDLMTIDVKAAPL